MRDSKRIQILLVEDDPDDVLLASEGLRMMKIANDLHLTMDGEEAMDFFHQRGRFEDVPVPSRRAKPSPSTATAQAKEFVGWGSNLLSTMASSREGRRRWLPAK